MRILLFNQQWFKEELTLLGHEVLSCGGEASNDIPLNNPFVSINNILADLPPGFIPDRLVFFDNSSPILFSGFNTTNIPKLFYSVDTHHHLFLHRMIGKCMNQVMVAQKDYINSFLPEEGSAEWLPLWASIKASPAEKKEYDAVFIGTLNPKLNPSRIEFFEELQKIVPVLCKSGHFPDYFTRAKIAINQTVKGDLNFRVFESLMCGPLLLTENISNGLFELFENGKHLVTYNKGDTKEAAEKIQYYLSHPVEATRIAESGRAHIIDHHLPFHRALKLEATLKNISESTQKISHFAGMVNFALIHETMFINGEKGCTAALVLALRELTLGINKNELFTNDLACIAIRACFAYDRIQMEGKGRVVLNCLIEAYPEIPVVKFIKVYSLIQEQNVTDAKELASKLFDIDTSGALFKADATFNLLFNPYNSPVPIEM
jgi:hypothetical protein